MRCTVKLFAAVREAVGREEAVVELGDGATVADLRRELLEQHPELSGLLAHCYFAVDGQYSSDSAHLSPNSEIACIPPVSGG